MDCTNLRNCCRGIVLAGAFLSAILTTTPAYAQICAASGGAACHSVSEDFTISGGTPDFFLTDTDVGQSEWKFLINASVNTGPSFFELVEAGLRTPFRIDGGARNNSIRVLSDGRVGIGTAAPMEELHIMDEGSGFGPAIRFDDNDSQIWELEADDASFAAFDVTGGNRPFQIEAGAPETSLYVASSGNIGIGTFAPLAGTGIHVVKSGFVIPTFESAGGDAVQFRLRSDSPNNRRVVGITNGGVVKSQLRLDDGAVILQGERDANRFALFNASGLVIEGATCLKSAGGMGCDAVFDPAYGLESIEEHAAAMWEDRHLPAVGPTPEGKPISFNVHKRHFAVLNELEKAHIYIEQLNERINQTAEEKDAEIVALKHDNEELKARLDRIEAFVNASLR